MSEVPMEFTSDSESLGKSLSPQDIEALASEMPDDSSPEFKDDED